MKKEQSQKIKDGLSGRGTICWKCRNAVPEGEYGCSWSRELKPVPGWTAVSHNIKVYPAWGRELGQESFKVVDCPEFIPDPPREEKPEHWLAP